VDFVMLWGCATIPGSTGRRRENYGAYWDYTLLRSRAALALAST
jgi:hypothetical protein